MVALDVVEEGVPVSGPRGEGGSLSESCALEGVGGGGRSRGGEGHSAATWGGGSVYRIVYISDENKPRKCRFPLSSTYVLS